MGLDPRTQAVLEAVAWHTVAIVPEKRLELATGVCLRFRDEYWVVTAGHAIKAWGLDRVFFITRPPVTLLTAAKGDLVRRFREEGSAHERFRPTIVGYVESDVVEDLILLRLAEPEGGIQFHALETAISSPTVGEQVLIFGLPMETARNATDAVSGEKAGMVFFTFDWLPVVDRSEQDFMDYDPRVHFLVDFPEGPDPTDYVTEPHGLSGAGLWRPPRPAPKDRIWNPRTVTLVGIQTGWYSRSRLLKATRIERVVDLLTSASRTASR